ncbi:MAG TPA: class I SAM-dependent methyltransferase [Terriglobales bacterium]|nr:class I SAM-dependent methyltransferase [Terriglobales bacterium]
MKAERVFDREHYESLNISRKPVVAKLVAETRRQMGLSTAADVGCGLGFFSNVLRSHGFRVGAIDGREENVRECRARYPEIDFHVADVEKPEVLDVGTFDLVLCFGLLYHLENPFRAIRNLCSLTDKVLLVESMCAPGSEPRMEFLDEFEAEDQGLNYVAFYPTESCLVKMLYRAGFPFVFGLAEPPDHQDFRELRKKKRARTMLVASKVILKSPDYVLLAEPRRLWDLWTAPVNPWRIKLGRVAQFARRCVGQPSLKAANGGT